MNNLPKYGRGLNREIVGAVNSGKIAEPITIKKVKEYAKTCNWNIPDNYINVCLSNAASLRHSKTYKKYFLSVGAGEYELALDYRGERWK